jgi:hypothetical protein
MPRRRHPSPHSNSFPLYAAETTLGWRVVRQIPLAEAERKVELGVFVRVYNEQFECVGYQVIDSRPTDEKLPSRQSSSSISASEIQANALVIFPGGSSRTERMSEERRVSRRHPISGNALPAEDFVELATGKVRAWLEIGDDKAPSSGQIRRKRLADERNRLQG